jgi:LysM repeat protein
MFYYLLINVFVSACTVVAVLTFWERRNIPAIPVIFPTQESPANPVSLVVSGTLAATTPQPAIEITPTDPSADLLKNVEEYQVEDGDTLGLIADKFDVSIDDLLRINQMNDPNSLSVGMVIYIPIPPERIPTDTPTPTFTPLPTGSLGPLPEARVVINSVIGTGDLATERVFLTRTGAGPLSVAGWRLEDEDGNVFLFPQLELFEGGAVNVWTTSGAPTVVDLYWGLQSPVWRQGEKVSLLDADGEERATYTVP